MASLQLRHSRSCALGKTWTKAVDTRTAKPEGCTCQPSYSVVVSLEAGGRRSVGKNFSEAKKALAKAQHEQNEGTLTVAPDKRFDVYAEEWLTAHTARETTLKTYRTTIAYAKKAFGSKKLRAITGKDIVAMLDKMPKGVGASTKAKHLRNLNGLFASAVKQGILGRNPIDSIPAQHKPRASKDESPYFEDDEIPRLLAALEGNDKALVQLALMSGMRAGELIALQWGDVDLTAREVKVRRAWKDGFGVEEPKSETSARTVLLIEQAARVLEDLLRDRDVPAEDELVFPSESNPDGYRRGWEMTKKLLYPAMERAGITNGRDFHSLRHTFARRAFEAGASVGWVSRQLGHSSTSVTEKRYEHWSQAARKREAEKLEGAWVL